MGSAVNLITARRAKNLLINSTFEFWQRFGTTASGTVTTPFYENDRWQFQSVAVSNYIISRQAHSNTNLALSRYAARVRRNTGNSSTGAYLFAQTLERRDSESLTGKKVTLSFSARRGANYSATNNELRAQVLYTLLNPDTAYLSGWSSTLSAGQVVVQLGTTMTRYSLTVDIPAGAVGVAANFRFDPTGTAGADDWFQIEDVQLEEGPTATAYEARGLSSAEELQLCQRYYEKGNASFQAYGSASPSLDSGIGHWLAWKVTKRVTPVVARTVTAQTDSNVSGAPGSNDQGLINTTTEGTQYSVVATGAGQKIFFRTITYEADAEL